MSLLYKTHKIYVAGSTGMVGSAICRLLNKKGFSYKNNNLLTIAKKDLDLKDDLRVDEWFSKNKPDIVIIAAARVGGILANRNYPVNFLLENLRIQNNLIENSWKHNVKRLLFLGSSCIYPRNCLQPIKEEYLLTKALEETNQWYAIAKIAGMKLCEAYRKQFNFDAISLMPTNLYGPDDNHDINSGHVIGSLISKFHEAKKNNTSEVVCWGTGSPLREFLFVDDLAEACLFSLEKWFPGNNDAPRNKSGEFLNWLNIGSDYEISIKDLAFMISEIVGYKGKIIWDKSKPDGTPRKKLDSSRINNLGWTASTNLDEGIRKTIESYRKSFNDENP